MNSIGSSEKKSIDLYLIVGQSNAAGYSIVSDREAAYRWAPELKSGFSHVHYAGNARSDPAGARYAYVENREIGWCQAALGFGVRNDSYIGPEAGMAKALSKAYNSETGRHAGMIKFTHGGTSLLDSRANGNRHGNWVSPSYAKDLGVEFSDRVPTGGLYRGLLEEVRRQVEALYGYGGFTEFRLKGLYWMQGEGNRMFLSEYRKAFTYWANDIRKDLADMMRGIVGGDACGAEELPIFVGTISATFSLENIDTEAELNRPFIEMQKTLGKTIPNCFAVDNSEYAMCCWDADRNEAVVLGTDRCHWNQADMLEIGENVGKAMMAVGSGKA